MGTFAYHADNPEISAITGNTVISGGKRSFQPFCHTFGVKNPKWKKTHEKGYFQMDTYNMWEVPEEMKTDTELGKIPVVMDFYIHYKSDMFLPVVDYGLEKTKKGDLAWIVFERNDDSDYKSLWVYAHFERRKHSLFARDLFNPLIKLIPELERIEDYYHGGGIYNVGPKLIFKHTNGIITDLGLNNVDLASHPDHGLFDPGDRNWGANAAWCLTPETRTAHYDCRADVFSLARAISWFEHGNFWLFDQELKEMPFDEAFRLSCERQIDMGLNGVGKHVLEKALAFNPNDRYQTLTEFFEALVYE